MSNDNDFWDMLFYKLLYNKPIDIKLIEKIFNYKKRDYKIGICKVLLSWTIINNNISINHHIIDKIIDELNILYRNNYYTYTYNEIIKYINFYQLS
ncbi:hypothetical protein [Alphaentomopoxvirus acuprea]|uniref:Uncharacterized protein n=1 Tax=Alphaentomopoxvirus acuprea TaxID=62099 RepID=W6JJ34_9POXV|nr:hypothetical protein BA82_gp237 [Anomala cuprea entomopoxvirus]BAO49597.1 hypothetical protein [Anomala cuprea entomopoxvirus]